MPEPINSIMGQYGPYAFGLVSMVVTVWMIVAAINWVWKRVGEPLTTSQRESSMAQSATAESLRKATENLNESLKGSRDISRLLTQVVERLEKATEKMIESGKP